MIKINIDAALSDELKQLYGTKRFRIRKPDCEIAVSPATGRKTEDVSLYGRLKYDISPHIHRNMAKDDQSILEKFLRHYFVDDQEVDEGKIEAYLFSEYPDRIIRTFWEYVCLEWSARIYRKPSKDYADRLCRVHSSQRFDLDENKRPKHSSMGGLLADRELAPFLDVYEVKGASSKAWRVRFRFHDELYHPQTGALTVLAAIFDYGKRITDQFRHEIMTKLAVSACPYCNRQYITNYTAENREKALADLDHYYCKSRYPFLALSLYNFVPSCQVCNSRFKLDADFYLTPHVNPHRRAFGAEGVFELADPNLLMDEDAWRNHENLTVRIKVTGKDAEAINNSIATFRLNEVYRSHTDYVREIIWKSKAYSQEMIELVRAEFGTLFSSDDEIRELIFGQYLSETDASKRPLAKLTQDLLDKDYHWR